MYRLQNWPYCEKCKKPVEGIVKFRDLENQQVVYVVNCHGEEEITPIQDIDLICSKRINFNRAFRNEK